MKLKKEWVLLASSFWASLPLMSVVACANSDSMTDLPVGTPGITAAKTPVLAADLDLSGSINEIRQLVNPQWVFEHKNAFLEGTLLFTKPSDIDETTLSIRSDPFDHTKAFLTFALVAGKATDQNNQPTTTSTTYEVTITGLIADNTNQQALVNAQKFFPTAFQLNPASLVLPINFKTQNLPLLQPKQNFGFETFLEPDSQKGQQNINDPQREEIGYDNDQGQKYIQITLNQGNQVQKSPFTLDGFLTTAQIAAEKEIQSQTYFNGPVFAVQTLKPNVKISEYLNETKLKELVDFQRPGTPNSVFKQIPPAEIKLKILQIEAVQMYGIDQSIQVQVQLTKADLAGLIVSFQIFGFQNVDEQILNTKASLWEFINQWQTIMAPLKVPLGQPYLDQLASSIQSRADLNALLDLINSDVKIELVDLIPGSQNDANGSLQAKFNFSSLAKPEIKIENQVLTLYGFKIKG